MWAWVKTDGEALRYIALSADAKPMAENLYRALWSFIICVGVTLTVSLMTKPIPDAKLAGLVYGATEIPDDGANSLWQKPIFWAVVVFVLFLVLNMIFW
jgi:SSS family solute:Na+ symporter